MSVLSIDKSGFASKSFIWVNLLLVVLALLTWFAANIDFRVASNGNQKVDIQFSKWDVRPADTVYAVDKNETLTLLADSERATTIIATPEVQFGSNEKQLWRVQADIRFIAENVSNNLTISNGVSVFHLKFTEAGDLLRYAGVNRLSSNRSILLVNELIEVPRNADEVTLKIHFRSNGRWIVRNLNIWEVRLSHQYKSLSILLVLIWLAYFIYLARFCWNIVGTKTLITFSIAMVFIFLVTVASQSLVKASLHNMQRLLELTNESDARKSVQLIYRHSHTVLFFIFGLFLYHFSTVASLSKWQIFCFGIGIALATEAVQRHVFTRTPQLHDLIFDFIGLILAFVLSSLYVWSSGRLKLFRNLG